MCQNRAFVNKLLAGQPTVACPFAEFHWRMSLNEYIDIGAYPSVVCPVGWGCIIHWLLLYVGVNLQNNFPGYNTNESDGEAPVMLQLWGMKSTPSLSSLSCPLWPRVVALDRVVSMGQIELNFLLMLNWIALNRIVLTFGWLTLLDRIEMILFFFFLHWNCVITLNWIVCVFHIETGYLF